MSVACQHSKHSTLASKMSAHLVYERLTRPQSVLSGVCHLLHATHTPRTLTRLCYAHASVLTGGRVQSGRRTLLVSKVYVT